MTEPQMPNSIKAADLKRQIVNLPDDADIIFQGNLSFYRVKNRGPNLYQIEFNDSFEGDHIRRP